MRVDPDALGQAGQPLLLELADSLGWVATLEFVMEDIGVVS
jgi:hypothetical protein